MTEDKITSSSSKFIWYLWKFCNLIGRIMAELKPFYTYVVFQQNIEPFWGPIGPIIKTINGELSAWTRSGAQRKVKSLHGPGDTVLKFRCIGMREIE